MFDTLKFEVSDCYENEKKEENSVFVFFYIYLICLNDHHYMSAVEQTKNKKKIILWVANSQYLILFYLVFCNLCLMIRINEIELATSFKINKIKKKISIDNCVVLLVGRQWVAHTTTINKKTKIFLFEFGEFLK